MRNVACSIEGMRCDNYQKNFLEIANFYIFVKINEIKDYNFNEYENERG